MMPNEDDSGMDAEIYAEPATDETKPETDSVDEESAANPTALIPISALGGKTKPGDTVTVRVVKLHGDEAEVEISESSDEESESDDETEDDEMRQLDEMEV